MWQRLNKPELKNLNAFSERIWEMEQRRPGNFPSFDFSEPLLVMSDYGGSHRGSRFESYSFLFVQPKTMAIWNEYRLAIRDVVKFREGRMAFKRLGADDRRRALPHWLDAADELDGLLVTIAVENSLRYPFAESDLDRLRQEFPEFRDFKPKTIHRIFLICHLLSVFVAGLSTPEQELIWITDQDDIAANAERLNILRWAFFTVSGHYLPSPLQRLHCATTEFDDGALQVEDLASLPDLLAGAMAEVFTAEAVGGGISAHETPAPIPDTVSAKTNEIIRWISSSERSLRRMTFAMYPDGDGMVRMPKLVYSFREANPVRP